MTGDKNLEKEIVVENNGDKKTIFISLKSVIFIVLFIVITLVVLLYINGRGLYEGSSVLMGN